MKTTFINKALLAIVALGVSFTSCDSDVFNVNADPFKNTVYKDDLTSPIAIYVESQPELSEYAKALRYSGTFSALNQASTGAAFTAFIPNNEAMQSFYASRGVSSVEELPRDYVRSFVLYHTLSGTIDVASFVSRKDHEPFTNLADELIYRTIDAEHAGEAILTNGGHVIEMGVEVSNGVIYILNQAMTPLVETVMDRAVETGSSSIMCDALRATGWADKISVVSDTVVELGFKRVYRRYYTLLNVSDEVFGRAGISSVESLKTKLSQLDKRGVGVDSLLNEYVGYHVMSNSYLVSDLAGAEAASSIRILGTNAKDQVMALTIDAEALTDADRLVFNKEAESARFDLPNCDIIAKNGYLHHIDSWLPVWEPDQAEVMWDFADYPEIKAAVVAAAGAEKYQPAVAPSSEPTNANVHVSNAACFTYEIGPSGTAPGSAYGAIDYVPTKTYPIRQTIDGVATTVVTSAYNNDRIVFNLGYMGWCKMKTPVIVKGKYRVEMKICYLSSHLFMKNQNDCKGGLLKVSFDDLAEQTEMVRPYTQVTTTYAGLYESTIFDEIEFDTTTDHDFRFDVMDRAASTNKSFSIQIDGIRFIPIK